MASDKIQIPRLPSIYRCQHFPSHYQLSSKSVLRVSLLLREAVLLSFLIITPHPDVSNTLLWRAIFIIKKLTIFCLQHEQMVLFSVVLKVLSISCAAESEMWIGRQITENICKRKIYMNSSPFREIYSLQSSSILGIVWHYWNLRKTLSLSISQAETWYDLKWVDLWKFYFHITALNKYSKVGL